MYNVFCSFASQANISLFKMHFLPNVRKGVFSLLYFHATSSPLSPLSLPVALSYLSLDLSLSLSLLSLSSTVTGLLKFVWTEDLHGPDVLWSNEDSCTMMVVEVEQYRQENRAGCCDYS